MTPATDALAEETLRRCRQQATALAWKVPFFLPIQAQVEFVATRDVPTACVDMRGKILVNPDFAAKHTDNEIAFIVAHEMMHPLLLHHARRGERDPLKWNIATDKIINRTLSQIASLLGAGMADERAPLRVPSSALMADYAQESWSAEQLYAAESEPSEEQRRAHEQGQLGVGQGCGPVAPMPGNGDADGEDVEPSEDATLRRRWHECAVACQMQGREAGSVAGKLLADAIEPPQPKVSWAQVLRGALHRALSEAGRDDVSWQRRSRRSTPEILLPGGITYRCRAAVVIDTSGSMSDAVLGRVLAETVQVVNHVRVPVFLVVHDYVVQWAGWVQPGTKTNVTESVKKRFLGRGGTSFDEAYVRVGKESGKFNVLVHMTDGEVGTWPARPANVRRLIAALTPSPMRGPVPEEARVIDIELE